MSSHCSQAEKHVCRWIRKNSAGADENHLNSCESSYDGCVEITEAPRTRFSPDGKLPKAIQLVATIVLWYSSTPFPD
jgi:hypothetical protein